MPQSVEPNKRHMIVMAVLEEELKIVSDVRHILKRSVFSHRLVMPGAPNFEASSIDVLGIAHLDLRAFVRHIKQNFVMPEFNKYLDQKERTLNREFEIVRDQMPTSQYQQAINKYIQRYEYGLSGRGSKILTGMPNSNISYAAIRNCCIEEISQIAFRINPQIPLDRIWRSINDGPGAQRFPGMGITLFPSRDLRGFVSLATGVLHNHFSQLILALREHGDVQAVLKQQQAWHVTVRRGVLDSYIAEEDYLVQIDGPGRPSGPKTNPRRPRP